MKNYAFLCMHILLMTVQVVDGQKLSCMYEDYIYFTDRASIEYREGDVTASLKHWKEAMNTGLFPKGRHVAMALQCAVNADDGDWSKSLAFQLAKGGVPLAYFERYKDEGWYADFIASDRDTMAVAEKHYNFAMRKA